MTVIDKEKRPWCTIRIVDVFQTPFGNPDLHLVRGEGNGEDVKEFQQDHQRDWKSWLEAEGYSLTDETMLVVEVFELIEGAEEQKAYQGILRIVTRRASVSEIVLKATQNGEIFCQMRLGFALRKRTCPWRYYPGLHRGF